VQLVAIGLVLGLIGAGTLTRLVRAMLFDVSPFDPATSLRPRSSLRPSHFLLATFRRGVQPAWILWSICAKMKHSGLPRNRGGSAPTLSGACSAVTHVTACMLAKSPNDSLHPEGSAVSLPPLLV
jgi:hypothetical protein